MKNEAIDVKSIHLRFEEHRWTYSLWELINLIGSNLTSIPKDTCCEYSLRKVTIILYNVEFVLKLMHYLYLIFLELDQLL